MTAEARRKLFFACAVSNVSLAVLARLAPVLVGVLVIPLLLFTLTAVALILLVLRRAALEIV
ncbi:MAG TPA: hypothetical protein VFV49_04450 [Thermoanaerobaculia bacterium]|nr:hypothetical protein [Thermoanaerobaculia bacterium]